VIDHRPLMARLRFELASHTQWQARPRECRTLAASGLDYLADGQDAATLHLLGAQAAAQLGDADAAGRAIIAAHDARERGHPNELLEIGGEFGLSRAPFIACAADPGLAVTSLLWALARPAAATRSPRTSRSCPRYPTTTAPRRSVWSAPA